MPALSSTPLCFPNVTRCLNILNLGIVLGTVCLASPVKFAMFCVHPAATSSQSTLQDFPCPHWYMRHRWIFLWARKLVGGQSLKDTVTRQGCACLPAALGGLCRAHLLLPAPKSDGSVPCAFGPGWLAIRPSASVLLPPWLQGAVWYGLSVG